MIPPQLVGTEHAFILYSGETEESFTKNAAHVVSSLGFSQYTGPNLNPAAADDLAALSTMYGMFAGLFAGRGGEKHPAGLQTGGCQWSQFGGICERPQAFMCELLLFRCITTRSSGLY